MDNERKVVKIASSGICGTNISNIIEALKNGNIVMLDEEIIDPLDYNKKEIFETIVNYDDIIEKNKKKHNWRKKNFYD